MSAPSPSAPTSSALAPTRAAKCAVELVGTFLLALVIGLAAFEPNGAAAFVGLAVAAVLVAIIYAGGHVSGAHYNPAVTLSVLLLRRMPAANVLPYLAAQAAGAALAAAATFTIKGDLELEPLDVDVARVLLAEAIFTFALVWVILSVAFAKAGVGDQVYGIAIAAIVLAGIHAVGPVSTAAFNPAVVLFFGITGALRWSDLWVLLAGNLAGALAATAFFRATVRQPRGAH